jgi:type VI secretion system protein ImpL
MQAYLRLKLNALQNNAKTINVAGELNADASQVFANLNNATVPVFYTHNGYEKIYEAQAKSYLKDTTNESWVFGPDYQTHYSSSDLDNFQSQMDALYWQDYLDAWNNALTQVNLTSFADLQTEMNILALLTSKNSPFVSLLKNIQANTNFDNAAITAGSSLFGKNKLAQTANSFNNQNAGNLVNNQFAPLTSLVNAPAGQPTQLQNIQGNLTALQQYLSGLANSSNPGLSAYNAAVQIFQGQADRSITALATIAAQIPQPMARWLNQIVSNTYTAIFAEANTYVMSQWQANIASFYQQALAGRYPFVKSANEATIQDFTNFFKPGGVEDSFVKKYLAPFITTDNFGHAAWASAANVTLSTNSALINEINAANQIRTTFFGSSNGALNFTLTPVNLTGPHKFIFSYDGKSVTNSGHAGVGIGFIWPPANTDGTITITYIRLLLSDVTETYTGPWALFRILEQASLVKSKNASSYTVTFHNDGMSASFILSASSVNNPFDIRMLRNYRCLEK